MADQVLILTDNPDDAKALVNILERNGSGYETIWVRHLSAALSRLRAKDIDAVIADLSLPDSDGVATFDELFAVGQHAPILVLSKTGREHLAIEAVRRGAQGYLSAGTFGSGIVLQTLNGVIRRKAIEEATFTERARAEIALNSISDAVICTDMLGNVDYLNIAAEHMTGWSRQEARGRPIATIFEIINGVTRKPHPNPVDLVLLNDEPMALNADTVLIRRDGSEVAIEDSASPIHDWNGRLTGVVIVFHDVSIAQAMSAKMAHLAQHDFLTDLPNRVLLNDRIGQAIRWAKRHDTQMAVLFLDLDNFKHTNDSLGHEIGDLLLQSVAQRLARCVRMSDTVSRQGGDEFVILLAEGKENETATVLAERILAAMRLQHQVAGRELHVSTSIGISVYPADGDNAETLVKNADTAMYSAKSNGRDNYQFFSRDMSTRAIERQFIEGELRFAIEKKQFALHYQPKVNLERGTITGVEALLRWNHPERGMLPPRIFIPVAEECGLIVPIGRWVMREACSQATRWIDQGLDIGSIAVNVSASEFVQKGFLDGVRNILSETGLAASRLQVEMTESVLMRDAEASATTLRALKELGVQLAIDDFGTGYSSLSYLTQFPIDTLKIDRSFVNDIQSVKHNGIIASAVIGMANNLRVSVVAEGIENNVQLAFLKEKDCEEGQGFLFSRPLTADRFAALVAAGLGDVRLRA
jgi:diguanylate cyclase (GGDEF)-like protein/PAS domain S-box-containing protein